MWDQPFFHADWRKEQWDSGNAESHETNRLQRLCGDCGCHEYAESNRKSDYQRGTRGLLPCLEVKPENRISWGQGILCLWRTPQRDPGKGRAVFQGNRRNNLQYHHKRILYHRRFKLVWRQERLGKADIHRVWKEDNYPKRNRQSINRRTVLSMQHQANRKTVRNCCASALEYRKWPALGAWYRIQRRSTAFKREKRDTQSWSGQKVCHVHYKVVESLLS